MCLSLTPRCLSHSRVLTRCVAALYTCAGRGARMILIFAIAGTSLLIALWMTTWVLSKPQGPQGMRDVALAIREGAGQGYDEACDARHLRPMLCGAGSSEALSPPMLCVTDPLEGERVQMH